MNYSALSPQQLRDLFRTNELVQPTSGMAKGYVQANVVILPKQYAYDFLLFCQRNPKSCPLLDVSETGDVSFPKFAPDSDIRTDVPQYFVYENGVHTKTVTDIKDLYTKDMVSFLLGCSFTFEHALLEADIPVRHIEENHNVPMYISNIPTVKSGVFEGPTTVSMRPMTMSQAIEATEITTHFKAVHGTPIHIGDPSAIGIKDINQPDFGEKVTTHDNEVPVFWACGVTPQSVCLNVKPSLMITHAPGHMFITDLKQAD